MKTKYIFIAFLSLGLLLFSCSEEFLDKAPQGALYYENLIDKKGIESLLIAAYGVLDGFSGWDSGSSAHSPGSNWVYGDVFADDAYKGGPDNTDMYEIALLEQYHIEPNNPALLSKWKAVYDAISRCNDVLRTIDLAIERNTIEMELAIQYEAEARFLRGYYHLEAIKMWDFVPFVDETVTFTSPFVENQPSGNINNAGEIPWKDLGGNGYIPWDKVEEDLQYAIDILPEEPRNGFKGCAYKYPALAIMGKIKWFQGDHLAALELFNLIINSGKFSLPDNFHDNFQAEGDNNSESIFQYQASVHDASDVANGNIGEIFNYPLALTVNQGGFDFFHPSQNLVNAFKTTDGTEGGVIAGLPFLKAFGLDFNEIDVINDEGLSSDDPFTPETRPLDPRLDWTVGRRGIPYLDWGIHPGKDWQRSPDFYAGPYHALKHSHHLDNPDLYYSGWTHFTANNYSIIRYADLLLMAADCEVEEGNLDRARDLVNMVRGRMADYPEYWVKDEQGNNAANYVITRYPIGGVSDPFQTQEGAREAVQFEKRLEMALEGHRFWDLKKWGIAKSTLNTYVEKESIKRTYLQNAIFEDRHIHFPIPQNEIDISESTLSQNPGY
jgi:hypothetical protein